MPNDSPFEEGHHRILLQRLPNILRRLSALRRGPTMNTTDRLPFPYRPEAEVAAALLQGLRGALDWAAVAARATPWVHAVRAQPAPFWAMESLLREYPISSAEGLALMRLAEALLRVPDAETAIALTADQLGRADFARTTPKARTACWPACRPAPSR
jgi:hypothetical protein